MRLSKGRGLRLVVYLAASAAVATATTTGVTTGVSAAVEPPAGKLLTAPTASAIEGSYIVVLKEGQAAQSASATRSVAQQLAADRKGQVGHVYSDVLQGFEVTMDADAARRLASDPAVAYVQQNSTWEPQQSGTQLQPPNGGLDRIDQTGRPLDGSYTYPATGAGVRVYVVDSGIRATHVDLRGRVQPGVDLVTGGDGMTDCLGHGTHVAAIVGGLRYGVAKGVQLVPVGVFGCNPRADAATVLAGLDWINANHAYRPSVVNISLSGPPNQAISAAITRLATSLVVVGAAGNSGTNACEYAPASSPDVLTVGATYNTLDDRPWPSSNHNNGDGACVDVWAPGTGIQSAVSLSDFSTEYRDGTSASAAFAAGAAAIIWSARPTMTALAIRGEVIRLAVWIDRRPDYNIYVHLYLPTPLPPSPPPPPPPVPPPGPPPNCRPTVCEIP